VEGSLFVVKRFDSSLSQMPNEMILHKKCVVYSLSTSFVLAISIY
jgi:hypothetical protein